MHICAIAAYCFVLAGRPEEARSYLGPAHMALPDYRTGNFLNARQFGPVRRQNASRRGDLWQISTEARYRSRPAAASTQIVTKFLLVEKLS
jgi:hypothetical protein